MTDDVAYVAEESAETGNVYASCIPARWLPWFRLNPKSKWRAVLTEAEFNGLEKAFCGSVLMADAPVQPDPGPDVTRFRVDLHIVRHPQDIANRVEPLPPFSP